jgi:uncharacterized membrane protein
MKRRKDENGAVALTVALVVTLLLAVASFALDLGLARVGVRDMQAVADVVALDMARQIDGRTVSAIEADTKWLQGRDDSVARNADTLGGEPTVTPVLGTLNSVTGVFTEMTGSEIPNAVRVTAASSVDFVLRGGDRSVSRSAVAQSVKSACFALGSYAARFRSGDSALVQTLLAPMNAFIQPQANLDALSYQGLALASVSLNEIAADSAVGTVDELLSANVTVDSLIRATIGALNRQSPQNSVAMTALNKILNGQAELSTPILLTKVVKVSPSDAAALDTRLNVLDLVTGAILLADGEHAVNVPNLSAGTGNLAPLSASLKVIERAQMACGTAGSAQAHAETSQLQGDIRMKLQLPTINGIAGIQGVVQTPESIFDIDINLGNAQGDLVTPGPICNQGTETSPDELNVRVGSGLAEFNVSTTLHFQGKLTIPLLSPLGIQIGTQLVDVTFDQIATVDLDRPDSTSVANLKVPPNDTVPVSTGTPTPMGQFSIASTATNVVAKISGVTVTAPATLALINTALAPVTAQLRLNSSVAGPLNSFIDSLNGLLTPLRLLLGLNVGGADVYSVGRPTCNGAALRG